jgi:hypothetical protein
MLSCAAGAPGNPEQIAECQSAPRQIPRSQEIVDVLLDRDAPNPRLSLQLGQHGII